MKQRDLAANQFGSRAAEYLASPVHAAGADLDWLTELAQRTRPRVLDLGCGAGHASFALARGGARVAARDLSQPMTEAVAAEAAARGHRDIEISCGPAEQLPFPDAAFDAVVTRYSAHHWLDLEAAVHEAARVLKAGGVLVVIDVLAPENALLDTVLQTVEILRDPSHVRDYRESEWRALLAAARLGVARIERWRLPMDFDSWVRRIGTSAARIAALETAFDGLPQEARDYFAVAAGRSFSIDAGWIEATRRAD